MSGSPKYQTVSSGEIRRRQAEQARKRREEQRKEKERQRLAAALERARALALSRAEDVAERVAALSREAATAGLAGDQAAENRLEQARERIRSATDRAAVGAAAGIAEEVERSLVGLRQRIDDHQREQAQERVEAVAAQLTEIPADVRARYDRGGAEECEELLDTARRYAGKAPAKSDARAETAAQAVREHLDKVLARRAEEQARTTAAREAAEEVYHRFAELRADAEQARVPLPDSDGINARLSDMATAVRQGDAGRVLAALPELTGLVDRAEAALDGHIDRVIERRELLNSIIQALPEAGFSVDRNSFVQREDGAMELRAGSTDGQQFAVLLRDGAGNATEVLYSTDTMHEAVAAGTGKAGECGSLLSVINRLSERTRSEGFEPGTVQWDDEDGDQPPPAAHAHSARPGVRGRTAG
ncbi:hypothetical protein [Paractinoplanes atraurantiacus]|uniref:Uncharacterized protein n=1 Tax=Paractinoplanes atraurantiacus TaxID=1036182 RepID=A0A285KBC1_9ACTN|nr:hypothetical protein [Actinoplanes atraurantiacus]SNY69533.1 hypothetical protein SAMN05421748_13567 [Actinoplanes atraurantiacus]